MDNDTIIPSTVHAIIKSGNTFIVLWITIIKLEFNKSSADINIINTFIFYF